MELNGTIKRIGKTYQVGESNYKKRDLVLVTDEKYPQTILVEFGGDKTGVLNRYKEGQKVTVGINLRGREWTNDKGEIKYFNTIVGWKIQGEDQTAEPALVEEDVDELPF